MPEVDPFVCAGIANMVEILAVSPMPPRLTDRCYRVGTARSRDLGGAGLDLSIVKHVVNRLRGSLEIESASGMGRASTVNLPAADGNAKPRAAS